MTTWIEAKGGNLSTAKCVEGCGLRMPFALLAIGMHAHPTCGPAARHDMDEAR